MLLSIPKQKCKTNNAYTLYKTKNVGFPLYARPTLIGPCPAHPIMNEQHESPRICIRNRAYRHSCRIYIIRRHYCVALSLIGFETGKLHKSQRQSVSNALFNSMSVLIFPPFMASVITNAAKITKIFYIEMYFAIFF